jgi:ANTAR domain
MPIRFSRLNVLTAHGSVRRPECVRAKGIMRQKYSLSEEEAYLRLHDESRQRRRPMRDLAEAVILATNSESKNSWNYSALIRLWDREEVLANSVCLGCPKLAPSIYGLSPDQNAETRQHSPLSEYYLFLP